MTFKTAAAGHLYLVYPWTTGLALVRGMRSFPRGVLLRWCCPQGVKLCILPLVFSEEARPADKQDGKRTEGLNNMQCGHL